MMNTFEVMDKGMSCLVENLGILEAENFIATVLRERFDYTEWRKQYYDGMTIEEINEQAVKYEKEHPYKGNGKVI